MNKIKHYLSIAAITAILVGVPVFPQQPNNQPSQTNGTDTKLTQNSQKEAAIKQGFESAELRAASEKCRKAQLVLQKHLDSSEEIKQTHLKKQQDAIKSIKNIAIRLDNTSNVDTSDLKDDVKQLGELSAKFETDFANYQASIRQGVNATCGNSADNTELKKAVSGIRNAREKLKNDVDSFADYAQGKVIKNLETVSKKVNSNQTVSGVEAWRV